MSRRHSIVAVAALSLGFLTACGTSPPPSRELAHEMVDVANDSSGNPLSDSVKACMHNAIDEFNLTEAELQGFKSLDDAFQKADEGQPQAQTIVDRFEAELALCTTGPRA